MAVKVATGELVLDALLENPNIKAAMLIDERGYVIERRGDAQAIKSIGDDRDTVVTGDDDSAPKSPSENLYILHTGDEYLVVVFDDRLSFERIKQSVDATLGEFDLAPETEE